MSEILRGQGCLQQAQAALTTSATTTPAIPFANYTSGLVRIPSGSSITSLTFHAATQFKAGDGADPLQAVTFSALYDRNNLAVVMTVAADRSYPLPAELIGAAAFKMVVDVAGAVELSLKA